MGADAPLRVAAYCRVSTDLPDQLGSLQNQQDYFLSHTARHPGWVLTQIYADRGVSGTSTHREAFCRMMADAQAGEMDLILTKEVSRFARNTVDALSCTRQLRDWGVGVLFLSDNIDTRSGDGELRLTIMAGMAQEESRKTSERVKWGQRRRMEAGVVFGNDTLYGYRLQKGVLTPDPLQAPVVRRIFQKCLLEHKGTHVIARELFEEGVPPPRSPSGRWSPAMVLRVLRNEKYTGDLLCKKYVTPDYLTHKKVPNRGQEEQFCLRDHHPPLIDRPTWEAVQAELDRRRSRQSEGSRHTQRHWCSGKVFCALCGSPFVPKTTRRPSGQTYILWGCARRVRQGKSACPAPMVNHQTLLTCARFALDLLRPDLPQITAQINEELAQLSSSAPDHELSTKIAQVEDKKARALDAYLSGLLTREEFALLRTKLDLELTHLSPAPAPGPTSHPPVSTLFPPSQHPPEVLEEVVNTLFLTPNCADLTLRPLPGTFRLHFTTQGAGKTYRTTIQSWELLK